MYYNGAWLHFRRARVGSVLSAAVRKIQASKCYVSPYQCCLKIEEAASHKVKGSLHRCLLIARLPSGIETLIWHFETIKTQLNNFQVFAVNFQHG